MFFLLHQVKSRWRSYHILYIGLYKPCINLPFGDCAMYFDHGVYWCFLVAIMFLSLISMATKLSHFDTPLRIHGTIGIFTLHQWLKVMVKVGKYTIVPWILCGRDKQKSLPSFLLVSYKKHGSLTHFFRFSTTTLLETNIAPENRPSQKERIVFQPSIFRGKLAVSFREGIFFFTAGPQDLPWQ